MISNDKHTSAVSHATHSKRNDHKFTNERLEEKAARGLVSIRPGSGKAKIMADTLLVFAYNSQHSEEQTQL